MDKRVVVKPIKLSIDSIEIVVSQITYILSFDEPESLNDLTQFFYDWFSDKIPGQKVTIVAEEQNTDGSVQPIGVVRFWKTPYCQDKWLIEGLAVISSKRRLGIGRAMVEHGLEILRERGVDQVSANISNRNIASIKLHESLGFTKVSTGSLNSFGEWRDHVDEYSLIFTI